VGGVALLKKSETLTGFGIWHDDTYIKASTACCGSAIYADIDRRQWYCSVCKGVQRSAPEMEVFPGSAASLTPLDRSWQSIEEWLSAWTGFAIENIEVKIEWQ
jgi:hypothetical protein